jgi:hypothetical protein
MSTITFFPFCSGRFRHALALTLFLTFGPDASPASAQASGQSWWQRIQFSGDFRSRYEGFYEKDKSTRNRVRLRLRVRLDTDINPDTHFQIQLASGDPGTPVSTNQTFTEYFLPKPFNLDRAVIHYNPSGAKALTLAVGKFTFPLERTQMVWDDDVNWEGGYQQVAWDAGERVGVKLIALQTAVNEVSAREDAFMLAGYGELTFGFGEHELLFSAANYGFGNVDQVAVATATGPLESINTNLIERDVSGRVIGFASDFNLVDVMGQVTIDTGRGGYPVRVLADWVRNTRAATDRDTGFWMEFEYGEARQTKSYSVGYTYGRIEQDSVLSPFVFSDMPGSGIDIHMPEISYLPLDGLSLDFTLHITRPLVARQGQPRNWLFRPHIAVVVRF